MVRACLLAALALLPGTAMAQSATFRDVIVLRVVDGDTWDVVVDLPVGVTFTARLRPLALDCAEPRGATREEGLRQAKALEALLFTAEDHRLDLYDVDSFGRWLVEAWADGMNVSAYMRTQGCEPFRGGGDGGA